MKAAGENGIKKKHIGAMVFVSIIIFLEVFFYAWCAVKCTEMGYRISNEQKTARRLSVVKKRLGVELASLKSPERIAWVAKNKLGLMMPGPGQIMVIK